MNEQFTWLTPHSQRERVGLTWRNRRHDDTTTRRHDDTTTRRKTSRAEYPLCAFAASPACGRQWQGREIWDHKHQDKH
jgi:hypothetical protein